MTTYDEFRALFDQDITPEAQQALGILRASSMTPLHAILGYSELIKMVVSERQPTELPDDFLDWVATIHNNARYLLDMIEAATDRKHRSILAAEQKENTQQRSVESWNYIQTHLPELQDYASYYDAFTQTAQRLGLSFDLSDLTCNADGAMPSETLRFHTNKRTIQFSSGVIEPYERKLQYYVALEWLADQRNLKWRGYHGGTPSLEQAVTVCHRWIIQNESLEQIHEDYPWLEVSPWHE